VRSVRQNITTLTGRTEMRLTSVELLERLARLFRAVAPLPSLRLRVSLLESLLPPNPRPTLGFTRRWPLRLLSLRASRGA
jgi:hypothetical protein